MELQVEKRGVRLCERNNAEDTKASEEGGRGGAPGTRAEIPLQVKTIVRQAASCSPWRLTVKQISTCSPWRTPRWSRWMPEGGCDAVEHPHWSGFPDRTCDLVGELCWSSLVLKDCAPWKGQVKRTHAGAVHKELQPMGRTHMEEVREGLCPVGGHWSRGRL